MRPRNDIARDRLPALLARRGPLGTSELAEALGVSRATVLRLLQEADPRLLFSTGEGAHRRNALRRPIPGQQQPMPVYQVDGAGQVHEVGLLSAAEPHHTHLVFGEPWPVPRNQRDGWREGLPYPVLDMRPQGYMGRGFAVAVHEQLGLDPDPDKWDDDGVLRALSSHGVDAPGAWILGDEAFTRWQAHAPAILGEADTAQAYAALATHWASASAHTSSAAGEFPKFTALRELPGSTTPHVIVKFSGQDESPAVRRWKDLLVCEHLALQALTTLDIDIARSRVVHSDGRVMLESERFDRHGPRGRSPLVSLGAFDVTFYGSADTNWLPVAERMRHDKLLSAPDLQRVRDLTWFGKLIGNTDMHAGNLSFVPQQGRTFRLAPAYDMLPMMYAPLPGGEVPAKRYALNPPRLWGAADKRRWEEVRQAAAAFWRAVLSDERISADFKSVAEGHLSRLPAP